MTDTDKGIDELHWWNDYELHWWNDEGQCRICGASRVFVEGKDRRQGIEAVMAKMPVVSGNQLTMLFDRYCGNDYGRASIESGRAIAEAQRRLLAEEGWHFPIEPLPKHCSEHSEFVDSCMGCQGVTSQYKGTDGEFHPIDWPSFHLGQDIMSKEGWIRLPTEDEFRNKFADLLQKSEELVNMIARGSRTGGDAGEILRKVLIKLHRWLATGEE